MIIFLTIFTCIFGLGVILSAIGIYLGLAMETDFGHFVAKTSVFNLVAASAIIIFSLFKIF
ncbi:MAG: hypothetical protein WC516_03535 [Patescibacteria group bacterium]